VLGGRSRLDIPPDGEVEPRPSEPDAGGHVLRRFAQRRIETLECLLERLPGQRLPQQVLAALGQVLGPPRRRLAAAAARQDGRDVAADRQADLQRGAAAVGGVIALQPLAQAAHLDPDDRVAGRVEGRRRQVEDLARQQRFLQRAGVAGHRIADDVAQQPLVARRATKRRAVDHARQRGLDQLGRRAAVAGRRRRRFGGRVR
jgi:hypothetical protein